MMGIRPEHRKYIVYWSFDRKNKKDRWIEAPIRAFSAIDAEGAALNSHHRAVVHEVKEVF